MQDPNKKIVLAYIDAFNHGDLDACCALFTPDALVWGVLGWGGLGKVRPIWKELIEGLQMQLQVEGLVAEGDTVVARFRETGKSVGPFRGMGPTGKTYE